MFTVPESDFSLTGKWFWIPGDTFRDAASLRTQIDLKLGQGAAIILNVPPNTTGVIPEEYLEQLALAEDARIATYGRPLALLPAPVSSGCTSLSFTLPVTGVFDTISISEGLNEGQVQSAWKEWPSISPTYYCAATCLLARAGDCVVLRRSLLYQRNLVQASGSRSDRRCVKFCPLLPVRSQSFGVRLSRDSRTRYLRCSRVQRVCAAF